MAIRPPGCSRLAGSLAWGRNRVAQVSKARWGAADRLPPEARRRGLVGSRRAGPARSLGPHMLSVGLPNRVERASCLSGKGRRMGRAFVDDDGPVRRDVVRVGLRDRPLDPVQGLPERPEPVPVARVA